MAKKTIAVVYGGYSSEIVVSRKSAEGVISFIDSNRFNVYPVLIEHNHWSATIEGEDIPVNRDDFSVTTTSGKIIPDCVYITIHGTPGEDGLLQGYLKMTGIPHSTCEVLPAALTFNKFACNNYLKGFGIRVANSVLLRKGTPYHLTEIAKNTGFPCFVKPNAGGSSFGVSKVHDIDKLDGAIEKAFAESNEVIIEQFIQGTEVTCGLYKTAAKTEIFPITEVISHNEFFDFEAKYTPEKAMEITPARLEQEVTLEIQNTSSFIYDIIGCKGIVRIDYIISQGHLYLLEVNTTPGMTPTSFIPQQIKAKGLDIKKIFTEILEDAMNRS